MSCKAFVFGRLSIAAGLVALAMTGSALAREVCTDAPVSEWKPMDEISAAAKKLGYTVTKVERDGTCYEVEGYDGNGAKIEIYYDPRSGKPVPHR